MSCKSKTHKLVIKTLGSNVERYWIDLEDGLVETDAAVLASLEALIDEEDCNDGPVSCVESQEWTYGIDNTGTRFNDVATYEIELSDGTILNFSQDGSSTNWTPQLQEWSNNIQTAANNAGLLWFVEPRFVDNPNPTNIDGTINGPNGTPSGLPGAPSEVVAVALIDGGMAWRYVNIQVCPGQPVPVAARRLTSNLYGDGEFDLTTAGPILGPIQRFFVCRECGEEPVWYLEDNITLATSGQIPDCYEPCGVLSQLPPPPTSDCTFEIDVACDNNNSTNTVDFTNTITRRAKICNGEQIAVDYFEADATDPASLVPYELAGDFVDCATGEPVPLPDPLLDCVNPANLTCKKKRTYSIFYDNGITPSSSSNSCGARPNYVRFNEGFTSLGWETGLGLVGVGDDIGPYTGWTDQLTNWFGFGDSHDPYGSTHAFNFQPAPTWRSWTIDGCNPDAQYGVWSLQRDDGCEYKVYPLKKSADVIETIWCLDTVDCEGVPTTKYYDQNPDGSTYTEVAAPEDADCYVPCDYVFPSVVIEGAVSPCETKEYTLCDNFNGNQTQFVQVVTTCGAQKIIERYTLQSYNTATSPDDLVEYNVQGEIVVCGTNDPFVEPIPDCENFEIAQLFTLVGDDFDGTLTNREWQGTQPNGALISDPELATTEGRRIRDAHDFGLTPDVSNTQNTLALNDTNNTAVELSIQVIDGFIELENGGWFRYAGPSEGYWAVELGECCGPLKDVAESGGFSSDRVMEFYLPKGVHQLRLWNVDTGGSNSSATLGYSLDGGVTYTNDNTPPNIRFGSAKIEEKCIAVKVCEDSGAIFDLLTGDLLDPVDLYVCSKMCVASCDCSGSGDGGGSGEVFDGNITDVTPNPDQTHVYVSGTGNVPAGLKTVTINNITGTTLINGGPFALGQGRRVDSISFDATEIDRARGLLPAFTLSGGTWQWIGLSAINEV